MKIKQVLGISWLNYISQFDINFNANEIFKLYNDTELTQIKKTCNDGMLKLYIDIYNKEKKN